MSKEYADIVAVLEPLADFCTQTSLTNAKLSDVEIEQIVSANKKLLQALEDTRCFIRSNKCHVALKHLETFVRKNRCLSNMSEEGLESLHSNFGQIVDKIKRSNHLKVLLYAAKQYSVKVFLFDRGEYEEL